jgi:hypothetical protein
MIIPSLFVPAWYASIKTVNIFGFLAVGISDDHAGMVMFSKAEKSARPAEEIAAGEKRANRTHSISWVC